jgi:hypothetical protein
MMTLHEALILAGALTRIGSEAARACEMANELWPEHRWQWQDQHVIVLLPVMPPPPSENETGARQ